MVKSPLAWSLVTFDMRCFPADPEDLPTSRLFQFKSGTVLDQGGGYISLSATGRSSAHSHTYMRMGFIRPTAVQHNVFSQPPDSLNDVPVQ